MRSTNFMGLDGFVWFVGVVENRLDPLKLGRVQVRVFGFHTDNKGLVPSDDLPWAQVCNAENEVPKIKEGSWVLGFFMDGSAAQSPFILGTISGIPQEVPTISLGFSDQRTSSELSSAPRLEGETSAVRNPRYLNESTINRLARNQNVENTNERETGVSTADSSSWDEPEDPYDAVYPYNKASISESGHVSEVDDTPGAERLKAAHRMGTFQEIHPDGSRVTKVVAKDYEIIADDKNVLIKGACNITVEGNANLYVKGDAIEKIDGTRSFITDNAVNIGTLDAAYVLARVDKVVQMFNLHKHISAPPGSPTTTPISQWTDDDISSDAVKVAT